MCWSPHWTSDIMIGQTSRLLGQDVLAAFRRATIKVALSELRTRPSWLRHLPDRTCRLTGFGVKWSECETDKKITQMESVHRLTRKSAVPILTMTTLSFYRQILARDMQFQNIGVGPRGLLCAARLAFTKKSSRVWDVKFQTPIFHNIRWCVTH
jgi:hypothetical protein